MPAVSLYPLLSPERGLMLKEGNDELGTSPKPLPVRCHSAAAASGGWNWAWLWLFVLKPQIVNYLKHGSCQEKHFMSVALDAYFNFTLTCKVFLYNSDLPFQTAFCSKKGAVKQMSNCLFTVIVLNHTESLSFKIFLKRHQTNSCFNKSTFSNKYSYLEVRWIGQL